MSGLLPSDPEALATQQQAYEEFGTPLLTPYAVVQRDPNGLSRKAQATAVKTAVAFDRQGGEGRLAFAFPIVNTLGLVPSSREHGTTAITYLFMRGGTDADYGTELAHRYADRLGPDSSTIGVTGSIPARLEQYRLIQDNLHLVELATVAAILLIVGVSFRALVAPVVTVVTAGVAFVISQRILGWLSSVSDLAMPKELTPIAVALMLGVVTDYSIFFYTGTRGRLALGERTRDAVRTTTAEFAPIVLTAGLLVSCGVATLMLGTLGFFRSFGPGMAITVATGLVVSLTLVPALLALFGRALFWPGLRRASPGPARWRQKLVYVASAKPLALIAVGASCFVLAVASSGLGHTGLGLSLVRSLPSSNEVERAGRAAGTGFAPGIVAPTMVVVREPGLAERRAGLLRLQRLLAREPGVAGVLGPGTQPLRRRFGVALAPSGDAARYLLVLDSPATESPAIQTLRRIQDDVPSLLQAAGLGRATAAYGGETALGVETVTAIEASLWRIALVAFAVNLVFLIVFLRSLLAPLYLVAASALTLAATMGITTYVFQDLLGAGGITYYLPVAVGVLLVSLGSDYNLFVVGRIWQEAERRPLREAISVAAPRAGRAIAVAGVALAASFGLLALVPIEPFRVLAFAMGVGILLDAILVRSILVPALIALFGDAGRWPRRAPGRAALARDDAVLAERA